MEVRGDPAAGLEGAYGKTGMDRRALLPHKRPAPETLAPIDKRRRDGKVGFTAPPHQVSTGGDRRTDAHRTGCNFFLAAWAIRQSRLFSASSRARAQLATSLPSRFWLL